MSNATYPKFKAWKANGVAPAAGYFLYTYDAGTNNNKVTYSDGALSVPNANPIVLDANGEANIFLGTGAYRFTLKTPAGATIWTFEPIEGAVVTSNTVNSLAELRALAVSSMSLVQVLGHTTAGDGGGGLFYYNTTSSTADNGGTVILPASAPGLGRWIRLYSGEVNVKWFGAKGDGATNDTAAIVAAAAVVQALPLGGILYFPTSSSQYLFASNLTFGTKTGVHMDDGAVLTSAGNTIAFGNGLEKSATQAFTSTVGLVTYSGQRPSPIVRPEWYGAVGDYDATTKLGTDGTAAFQAAINSLDASGGGELLVGKGNYKITSTLNIPYRNFTMRGSSVSPSRLVYKGTTYSDLISMAFNVDAENVKILNMQLYGGDSTYTGVGSDVMNPCRYLFHSLWFTNQCEISGCEFRNAVGCIYLGQCFFAKITSNTFSNTRARCDATLPGWTAATGLNLSLFQWQQVWGFNSAPIYMSSANAATILGNGSFRIGTEGHTGTKGYHYWYLQGVLPNFKGNAIESCLTYAGNGTTYNISGNTTYALYCNSVRGAIEVYMESVTVDASLVFSQYEGKLTIENSFFDTCICLDALVASANTGDVRVSKSTFRQVTSARLWRTYTTDGGNESTVNFDDCLVLAGTERSVSPNVNPDDVYDTGNTANLLGLIDHTSPTVNNLRKRFPRKIFGYVVTKGSGAAYLDGSIVGDYIQITFGIYVNEAGETVNCKRLTGNLAALAVQRLRPNVANQYWRVYVGKAGQPYLVGQVGAFTTLTGDWIAQFRTNGATNICDLTLAAYADGVTLTDVNARVTTGDGLYPDQNSNATGSGALKQGIGTDDVYADRLGVGAAPVSGANLHVQGAVDGAFEFLRASNTDSTAASVNELLRAHFRLRGGGTASDRTAAYIEVRKSGDFGSAAARDGIIALMPAADEVPFDALVCQPDGRVQVPAGRLEVTQPTAGNAVFTLSTTTVGVAPQEAVYQNRVSTNDATVTTLATLAIPATTTVHIKATITARRTGGVAGTAEDGAFYQVEGTFKNVAGVATIIGALNNLVTQEDQAAWDATLVVSGANVNVRVTGAVNNTITWHATVRTYQVST